MGVNMHCWQSADRAQCAHCVLVLCWDLHVSHTHTHTHLYFPELPAQIVGLNSLLGVLLLPELQLTSQLNLSVHKHQWKEEWTITHRDTEPL